VITFKNIYSDTHRDFCGSRTIVTLHLDCHLRLDTHLELQLKKLPLKSLEQIEQLHSSNSQKYSNRDAQKLLVTLLPIYFNQAIGFVRYSLHESYKLKKLSLTSIVW
jgi:hypothetical protein